MCSVCSGFQDGVVVGNTYCCNGFQACQGATNVQLGSLHLCCNGVQSCQLADFDGDVGAFNLVNCKGNQACDQTDLTGTNGHFLCCIDEPGEGEACTNVQE